jgi:hypothetical protein
MWDVKTLESHNAIPVDGHKNVSTCLSKFKKWATFNRKAFSDKLCILSHNGAVYIYMTMNGLQATD